MKCPNCLVDSKAHANMLDALKAVLDDWHSHPENIELIEPAYLVTTRAAIKAATS